jgi:hypothetical protein
MRRMKTRSRQSPSIGLRIPRRRRMSLYVALAVLFGSGILWLVFHYFLMRRGEFGMEPHALEAWWLRLHGAAAFVILWFAGLLWGTHARPNLMRQRWRASGIVIVTLLALLAISGYLLYYAANDGLHDAARLVHWVLGLSLAVPLLIHIFGGQRRSR